MRLGSINEPCPICERTIVQGYTSQDGICPRKPYCPRRDPDRRVSKRRELKHRREDDRKK